MGTVDLQAQSGRCWRDAEIGRRLRTEIEGGRYSREGCFRVPPYMLSEYSVSSHLANEYTNVAPSKTPVFRVDNISDITGLRIQLYINCYQDVSRLRSLAVEAWNTALEVNLTKARAVTWFHGYRYKMMQTYTNKFYNMYIYTYICIDRLRTRKSSSRSIFDGELEGKSSKKLEIQ